MATAWTTAGQPIPPYVLAASLVGTGGTPAPVTEGRIYPPES